MSNKGFTLIELLVVVAIIGILALIAIPNYLSIRQRSYDKVAEGLGRSISAAEEMYYNYRSGQLGNFTGDLDDLIVYDKTLDDDPNITFWFSHIGQSGYTLLTKHNNGTGKVHTFTEMGYQSNF